MAKKTNVSKPNGYQKQQISVIAVCGMSTVDRVYNGEGNENSRIRVTRAAQQIGAPLPPQREARA